MSASPRISLAKGLARSLRSFLSETVPIAGVFDRAATSPPGEIRYCPERLARGAIDAGQRCPRLAAPRGLRKRHPSVADRVNRSDSVVARRELNLRPRTSSTNPAKDPIGKIGSDARRTILCTSTNHGFHRELRAPGGKSDVGHRADGRRFHPSSGGQRHRHRRVGQL